MLELRIRLARGIELLEIRAEPALLGDRRLLGSRRAPDDPWQILTSRRDVGQLSRPLVVVLAEQEYRERGLVKLIGEVHGAVGKDPVTMSRQLRVERLLRGLHIVRRTGWIQEYRRALVPHALQQANQLAHQTSEARLELGRAHHKRIRIVTKRDVGQSRKQRPVLVAVDWQDRAAKREQVVGEARSEPVRRFGRPSWKMRHSSSTQYRDRM